VTDGKSIYKESCTIYEQVGLTLLCWLQMAISNSTGWVSSINLILLGAWMVWVGPACGISVQGGDIIILAQKGVYINRYVYKYCRGEEKLLNPLTGMLSSPCARHYGFLEPQNHKLYF
jgi:hypothetical protein